MFSFNGVNNSAEYLKEVAMHSLLLFAVLAVTCCARYESEVPLFVWSEEKCVLAAATSHTLVL
jgi:hypothetical protein